MTTDGRTDYLLERFEREYQDMNSVCTRYRDEQLVLLRKFAASLNGRPLDALTADDVRTFIGADMAAGLRPRTGDNHLGMIRAFVNWADGAGLIEEVRYLRLQSVPKPRGAGRRRAPRPYKATEIHEFYELMRTKLPTPPATGIGSRYPRWHILRKGTLPPNGRMRPVVRSFAMRLQFEAQVALALECGLRRIEIHSLSIPALHFDNDELVVLTAKQGPGSPVTRSIPYPEHARRVMREWLDFRHRLVCDHESPWIYLRNHPTLGLTQLSAQPFYHFGRSLERTFGHRWEWHRFRHTAATEWLRSGVPLEKVQVFMGHSTVDMTLCYTEILKRDITKEFGAAEADFAKRLGLAA